jgi:JAB domain-containing protein similar to deubiquitination enzymes
MKVDPVEISGREINKTVRILCGAEGSECVLLWLGKREPDKQRVVEVYKPTQIASYDYFEIPRCGMADLMTHLRARSLYVCAQVHTHPGEAFHSQADDKWAIIRHHWALSIVLPEFAQRTSLDNFLIEAAVYQLQPSNSWARLQGPYLERALRVIP